MAFVGKVKAGSNTGPVGSSLYGFCDTPKDDPAKLAVIPALDTLFDGLTVHIKFINENTAANPTLMIGTTGAVAAPIMRYTANPPGSGVRASWYAGSVLSLTYADGAWWINDWQSDTTYENATTNAAGLMSAADKTTLNNIRDKRTTSLAFQNVPTSEWTQDVSGPYPSYPYKATLSCPGVTTAHFVQVCFKPEHVINYVPAPVCQVPSDGTVQVWAMINPGSSIEVPTVFAILPDRT